MKVEQFIRKSFPVEAVQVTAENMEELAKWCDGEVRVDESSSNPSRNPNYIKVRVQNPLTERQTKAYVGDWVLYAGKGYKVYTDKAFRKSFDEPINRPQEKESVDEPETQNVFSSQETPSGISAGGANPGGTHG